MAEEFYEVEDLLCDLCGQMFDNRNQASGIQIQPRRSPNATGGLNRPLQLCINCAAEVSNAYQVAARHELNDE